MTQFPIDLGAYQRISLNPKNATLTAEQRTALKANIQLCRDAIVFSPPQAQHVALADIPAAHTILYLKL